MMASRFKFARNFSITQQQVDILRTGTEMLNPCIQLMTDYNAIDKMSYIFLLKMKNFTFMGYSSKILKFRFSLKWFEENSMIWVAWMRLFLTKNNCVICLSEFSTCTEKATIVKTGIPNLIKYSEQWGWRITSSLSRDRENEEATG